ncbi:MAG: AAA family ATPase [Actinomycetota bacterium]
MTVRRIGLLGGESTGKSTLARSLADALPALVAEEYLRDFVEAHGRAPLPPDQEGIYLTQQASAATVERAAAATHTPWVIVDPLPLMTAVYSVVYFDDDSLMKPGLDDASSYDVLLWCAPDIPWASDDGVRDGSDFRDRADAVISEVIAPTLPLHRMCGSADERLASALSLAATP